MRFRDVHRSNRAFRRSKAARLRYESLEARQLMAGDFVGPEPQAIIGGGPAEPDAYPWVVSLENEFGDHYCGAAIIAPDRLLTAAHCVRGQHPKDVDAIIGRYDLSTSTGEELDVRKIYIHPRYNSPTLDSDVAVLELASETTAPTIDFVTSDDAALFEPGALAITLGWGELDDGSRPNKLNEVFVPIVSNEQANEPDGYDGDITENMLAAGAVGRDACQGDSGGPLVVSDGFGGHVLAGVVSWGRGCGDEGKPGIYTRLANYTEFIDDPENFVAPPDDHSDRPTFATQITNGRHSGDLEVSNDSDYFSFTVVADQPIVLETTLDTLTDSILTLYGADGTTVLAEDDNSGNILASKLKFTPKVTETVFVRVTSFGFSGGTYDLFLTGAQVNTIFGGDVNRDGEVDSRDLNILALNWLKEDSDLEWTDGDLDGDGKVGSSDLNLIGQTWRSNQSDARIARSPRKATPKPVFESIDERRSVGDKVTDGLVTVSDATEWKRTVVRKQNQLRRLSRFAP